MRMENDRNERIRPVCKFGPGGDYVSFWPAGSFELPQLSPNSLTKVLMGLSKIMENLVRRESGKISTVCAATAGPEKRIVYGKGDSEDVVEKHTSEGSADAASGAVAENDCPGTGERLLFADDRGISGSAWHKPKHHIRAHRRASRKRAAVGTGGQGTLFEADFEGAKSA
jgi:hypothetical protein